MKTFQINDEDGNSIGIMQTTADEKLITALYTEFCTVEIYKDVQGDIEEFVDFCEIKYPNNHRFLRYFLDSVIPHPQQNNYARIMKSYYFPYHCGQSR